MPKVPQPGCQSLAPFQGKLRCNLIVKLRHPHSLGDSSSPIHSAYVRKVKHLTYALCILKAMEEPPLDVEAPLACPTVVSAGWSSHLVLWPEEWFPRFYRKRRNGWQWQTWGIDALEWVAFNHDLFQCKVVELPLETLRKLLELYRFALGEGHQVWGFWSSCIRLSRKTAQGYGSIGCLRDWSGKWPKPIRRTNVPSIHR